MIVEGNFEGFCGVFICMWRLCVCVCLCSGGFIYGNRLFQFGMLKILILKYYLEKIKYRNPSLISFASFKKLL